MVTEEKAKESPQSLSDFQKRLRDFFKEKKWDDLNACLSLETPKNRAFYFRLLWQESEKNISDFLSHVTEDALHSPSDWITGVPLPILRSLMSKPNQEDLVLEMINKRMILQVNSMMDVLDTSSREKVITHPYIKRMLKKYPTLTNIRHFKNVTEQKKELTESLQKNIDTKKPKKSKL